MNAIRSLLRRRDADEGPFDLDADLYEDVGLDSLELAELSAILEDELGSDPYSAGLVPRTLGELLDFYQPA
jgi:acyl carrier protein